MLFERWDASRGIATTKLLKADAKAALQDVALWMFTTQGLGDGVTERQLISRLTEFWTRRRYEDHGRATDAAKELVALWRGRAWILTDVGSSPANHGLIYQFTHRTFLEYFAAMEIVRRNPSPETLWRTLAEPLRMGKWEIVAQLAIQKFDEAHLDGADQVLALLIAEEETLHGMPREHGNLLFLRRPQPGQPVRQAIDAAAAGRRSHASCHARGAGRSPCQRGVGLGGRHRGLGRAV